jgi:hypothetical protein
VGAHILGNQQHGESDEQTSPCFHMHSIQPVTGYNGFCRCLRDQDGHVAG